MSGGIVLAARNDGFGSRMVAFLNAMYVAETCGLEFKFVWPSMKEIGDFHVVPGPDQVFSRTYRRAHQSRGHSRSALARVPGEEVSTDCTRHTLRERPYVGLRVDICHAAVRLVGQPIAYDAFSRLWSTIGWTPRLRRLMQRAADQVPSGAVAVHLRRGDIVAGVSRFHLFNAKYVPLGWYHRIISDLVRSGTPVLLFCDDPAVQQALMRRFPGIQTIDGTLLEPLSTFERDIFAFSAMARCSRIIGGNSGFSYLAGLASGRPCELPASLIPAPERRRLIEADLAEFPEDYSRLHRAKELQWLALELPELLAVGERDALLREASVLDPDCASYARLRAIEMAAQGDFDGAERVLSAAMGSLFDRSGRTASPLRSMRLGLISLGRPVRADMPAPADAAAHPLVAAVAAVRSTAFGSPQRAAIAATVSAARPDDDVLLAFHADELRASGDARASLDCLEAAFRRGRDAPLLRRFAMMAAAAQPDLGKAVEHGLAALAAARDDNVLALRVTELLLRSGDRAGAQEVVARWAPADFRTARDLNRLSRLLEKVGRRREAIVAARRAAELSPANRLYQRRRESLGPLGSLIRRVRGALGRARRLAGVTRPVPAPR